jgi:copper chaperone CopZ
VKDCKASFQNGTAEVTYDPAKTTSESIARVISDKTGYKAAAPERTKQ